MSWRATLPCTRVQAESLPDAQELLPFGDSQPVLVADEPDPARPNEWLLHAYFDKQPSAEVLEALARLGCGEARVEQLGEDDWVAMSQSGLQPIRAGRFFVHTPTHRGVAPEGSVAFEIDAGLAFGTGQHATTAGCLEALDGLERDGRQFANIADVGTGTACCVRRDGAVAERAASHRVYRGGRVARDNSAINSSPLGHGGGELLLAVATGWTQPLVAGTAAVDSSSPTSLPGR